MMSKNAEIAIIIGTRAELIKTFPIMLELQKKKIDYYFIHTGQHNLRDLCKKFGVKIPDVVLTQEPDKSSKFHARAGKAALWNFSLIFKIRKELKKLGNLRYVAYHGDTMTTASAAIASSKLFNPWKKFKNIHLEAGLRSGTIKEPFPEEIARKIADRFSDILLAVSERAEKNLKNEGRKGKIVLFGNTILDAAAYSINLSKTKPLAKGKFALISIHRHENIKNRQRLEQIIEILSSLEIPSFFPMHDNTLKKLEEFELLEKLKENKNIKIVSPLDYPDFIYQVSKCALLLCDGGSMQEESLIFGKPCILLRKATERQEGLDSNFQFLSGLDVEKSKEKIKEYLSTNFKAKMIKNPYGNKGLSKKIHEVLG